MNWIKENKFLFGFLVVMALGIVVLGWFVLGARGRYQDATADYQRRFGELNRLQRLPTFPNQKNLDKIVAQQTEVNTEVSTLASALAAQQVPQDDMTPEQFQDKLKAAVTTVRARAAGASPPVKLPSEKFFLGFEKYETTPPKKEAASALGRELKVIEWLCTLLIDSRIAELKKLDRAPLPEEGDGAKAQAKKAATPAPAKASAGKAGKGAPSPKADVKHEIEKHRIEVTLVADQERLRQVLNAIVAYKGQFIIPRLVVVKNEKPNAPSRGIAVPEAAPAAPDAAANPNPAAPPPEGAAPAAAAGATNYIVGEEKVDTTLVLEMVDFSEVAAK